MRIRQQLHAFITAAEDLPGIWVSWCPELDVCTQGDNPDNATAMLEEACRMVVEDSVCNYRPCTVILGDVMSKKVVHPLRLGARSKDDESWPAFQDVLEKQNSSHRLEIVELTQLADGLDKTILVNGSLDVYTRSGVFRVDIDFDFYGYVPCEQFVVEYRQAHDRRTSFSMRSSVLKAAGLNGQNLVTLEAGLVAQNAVGEVKVSRS